MWAAYKTITAHMTTYIVKPLLSNMWVIVDRLVYLAKGTCESITVELLEKL